ncbi:hypothetical protein D3874_03660 [Oleomonas cavernae]|uniref:DUF2497 domain-containing protein n=1 Tax=Oleomonas cavernae TaxID=2320859 RepID=A0A418WNP5_9PROT|nr:hypothetical protein D3874_03660 [Oleomonas cavernae]
MTDELKREGEGAKGAADPTMEEILASIRRIIAEDGDGRPEGPPPMPSRPAMPLETLRGTRPGTPPAKSST